MSMNAMRYELRALPWGSEGEYAVKARGLQSTVQWSKGAVVAPLAGFNKDHHLDGSPAHTS